MPHGFAQIARRSVKNNKAVMPMGVAEVAQAVNLLWVHHPQKSAVQANYDQHFPHSSQLIMMTFFCKKL
jgi:hypothetical protein